MRRLEAMANTHEVVRPSARYGLRHLRLPALQLSVLDDLLREADFSRTRTSAPMLPEHTDLVDCSGLPPDSWPTFQGRSVDGDRGGDALTNNPATIAAARYSAMQA